MRLPRIALTLGDPDALPYRWYIRRGDEWYFTGPMAASELPGDAQARYRVLD